ncbi:MAG: macro domain-containing protein [Actinobacteria bacterium]|nr:macro domain-containing protein [Actinomycetota bacterium]
MSTQYKVGNSVLEITIGDITLQETDAIVNSANSQLAAGGGVSGAIHHVAGPRLWDECKPLGGCGTGEAKITRGYNLSAAYVIHTVGPMYAGRVCDPENLKNSYLNSLDLASKNNLKSISFPSISTGVFGYPENEASYIALKAIIDWLNNNPGFELVRMVLHSEEAYNIYKSALDNLMNSC